MPMPTRLRGGAVSAVRHAIYLHGFMSSPLSSKAQRFRRELAALSVTFGCPDFNQPDFETLTVTRMIDQTQQAIEQAPAGPVALIGSSLGAFVALQVIGTGAVPRVDRLILLAPALDFGANRLTRLGDYTIDEWRRAGRITLFHYAANAPREIRFSLYQDAARYDAFTVDVKLPTLVFQGRADETVDPGSVEGWARDRPAVALRLVDDGHQLAASMEAIWTESAEWLGLSRVPPASSAPRA
jgi:pimeloyl-ACP methyl ester carboxylesterase